MNAMTCGVTTKHHGTWGSGVGFATGQFLKIPRPCLITYQGGRGSCTACMTMQSGRRRPLEGL